MARISELHYSNAYARASGVQEFVEVALDPSEDPANYTVAFYQANGTQGYTVSLDDPNVMVTYDPESGENVYVISAAQHPILLTDPDGGGSSNYEATALVNTASGDVIDFYDIGGGTQEITAQNGLAAGETSVNLPVLVGPNATTTTLQFNAPDTETLVYEAVNPGDSGIACFVAGTLVETPDGPSVIEDLEPGDLVTTIDAGPQPLRWIGISEVDGRGDFAPIRIRRGTLGTTRDLLVSPQHRMLVTGWQAELLTGEAEVLIAAKHLLNDATITRIPCARVRYVHLLFDDHHILRAEGALSESYLPGPSSLSQIAPETAEELFALFPYLRRRRHAYGLPARPLAPARVGALIGAIQK